MKIALVNYRYFISGGPETYMFNIKEILEKNGHEVIPFSVKHDKNVKTEYEHYFIDPIGKGTEVYNHEYPTDLRTRLKVISRILYSFEAKTKFRKFLIETKPDVVYILQFQNKISCSIIDAAKELNIPVVQRISDYNHICTNAHFYHHKTGICEKCTEIGVFQSVKNKCISDSYIHSGLKAIALEIMRFKDTRNKIDAYIFPSDFTLQKFAKVGFNINSLHCVPTFFNMNLIDNSKIIKYNDFALYIGRIEKEKGIETLIDAFLLTNYQLKLIGFSNDEYSKRMQEKIIGRENQIQFLGKLDFTQIQEYLSECLFTVVPSEWYENFPNTILESFAFKKAVIATDIGSLPEIVNEKNGSVFEYKSVTSLLNKINLHFSNTKTTIEKGQHAYSDLKRLYSEHSHYSNLIQIFSNLLSNKCT